MSRTMLPCRRSYTCILWNR